MRKILHIDMDCFYAAIEMRDYPQYAHLPLAVGGDPSRRGVISTCNYAARRFGVRSAMASAHAMKLCPSLILQPVRMDVYVHESQQIRKIFAQYTDLVEPLSLDEAYLDVTDCQQQQGSATWIAAAIRQQIFQTTQLTASAGIAANKSLAKIASDWHKPNGQMTIVPSAVAKFVIDLPVRKLFGVGPKMEQQLLSMNIKTCGQLQQYPKKTLIDCFGQYGERLYDLARGIDERPVDPKRIRKSISVEETFAIDLIDVNACIDVLPTLLLKLQTRLQCQSEKVIIHNIFVKLKFNDFHQTTVERVGDLLVEDVLIQMINEGYARRQLPVRLIGIGIKLKQPTQEQRCQLHLPGF